MATLKKQRMLVLENGSVHKGTGFGSMNEAVCQLVLSTAIVGYQELVTDPSFTGEAVLMTYPLIGNYGITDEDNESRVPTMAGLIVREYCDMPSNFRYTKTLGEILEENGIPGLEGVDTREISRMLRKEGSMRCVICDAEVPVEEAMEKIANYKPADNLIGRVSCRKKWYARTPNPRFSVVAIDCGIKMSIIRKLNEFGCNVTVVPYDTPAEKILSVKPDGVVVSNGPGNPEDAQCVIDTVRELRGKIPMMGICLGHQIMALACGAKVDQIKFARGGGNHPVRHLESGKVVIASQNHSYTVNEASLEGTGLKVTYKDLLSGDVEGLASEKDKMFSLQFHPEGAAGPQDSIKIFGQFIALMEGEKNNA